MREHPEKAGNEFFVHHSTDLGHNIKIGKGTRIWQNSHIRDNVTIGDDVVIGRNVYIGPNISIGSRSKIQNNAQIFEPAEIGEGVFVGPGVIFTNDHNPRAINASGELKGKLDWEQSKTIVRKGASIGAGSICVSPVVINEWAMIGAGSVIINEVPAYALVVGVPARRIGWIGKSGIKLRNIGDNNYICDLTKETFVQISQNKLVLK